MQKQIFTKQAGELVVISRDAYKKMKAVEHNDSIPDRRRDANYLTDLIPLKEPKAKK
jgi:hypothetical protein